MKQLYFTLYGVKYADMVIFFNLVVSKVWQIFPKFQHLRKNYSSQKNPKTSQIFVVCHSVKICQKNTHTVNSTSVCEVLSYN